MSLLRPAGAGLLYLHRADDQEEFTIVPSDEVVMLAALVPQLPRARPRGAAHEAFSTIFSLPFDRAAEESYVFRAPPDPYKETTADRRARLRRNLGWGSVGLGAASLVSAVGLSISVAVLHGDNSGSQRDIFARNAGIQDRNIASGVLYGLAGAAVISGALLLLWPRHPTALSVGSFPTGGEIGYARQF